jgi:hypothetical protein
MAMALCFNCGEIKFRSIGPCPRCQIASSGDIGLDMAFSERQYDVETLQEFAGVLKAIHSAVDDPSTRFWAFIQYVSEHHPVILKANTPPELRDRVIGVLRGIVLPPVTLRQPPGQGNRGSGPRDGA